MSTTPVQTLADLLERLGGVDPARVRLEPPPGCATEADLVEAQRRDNRPCELVDGALVEKATGFRESIIAVALLVSLRDYVKPRNLGVVTGVGGTMRILPGIVRAPSAAYVSWDRLPSRRMPLVPAPALAPNVAAEVLCEGNTRAEMERKLREYFASGVELAWVVDLEARTVAVYTAADRVTLRSESETLDGGTVLPGFSLPLSDLFAEVDELG